MLIMMCVKWIVKWIVWRVNKYELHTSRNIVSHINAKCQYFVTQFLNHYCFNESRRESGGELSLLLCVDIIISETKVMKINEIHPRYWKSYENHKNLRNLYENVENHENLRNPCENHESNENHWNQKENYANNKNLINPLENQ